MLEPSCCCSYQNEFSPTKNVLLDCQRLLEMKDSLNTDHCNFDQEPHLQISNDLGLRRDNAQVENSYNVYRSWPGINIPLVEESLWDHNYTPPIDTWNESKFDNGISYNSLGNSFQTSSNIWNNSLSSIWKADDLSSPSHNAANYSEVSTFEDKSATNLNNFSEVKESKSFQSPSALWKSQ